MCLVSGFRGLGASGFWIQRLQALGAQRLRREFRIQLDLGPLHRAASNPDDTETCPPPGYSQLVTGLLLNKEQHRLSAQLPPDRLQVPASRSATVHYLHMYGMSVGETEEEGSAGVYPS